ncbi:MAG: histidine kinase [Bradyrhizobium sp.]|nr:histidine kinase [Bradyrhizobium sp.]
MPSLSRFLLALAVIAAIAYGAIYVLANFVDPRPREMIVTIPPDKFLKK